MKLRCCLVLQIALADLLFGALTLSASAAILLGKPSSDTAFCKIVGPALDYASFWLYMTVANLAHYSLWRLQNRSAQRRALLWRYIGLSVLIAGILGTAVAVVVLLPGSAGDSHVFGGGYRLTHGMCAISAPVAIAIMTLLERGFEAYILFVMVRMQMVVHKRHAPSLVHRQQRIANGYIVVAIVQGMVFWVPYAVTSLAWQLPHAVQGVQFSIGLSWPIGNWVVFLLITRQTLACIKYNNTAIPVKVVGFSSLDSGGTPLIVAEGRDNDEWRNAQEELIAGRVGEQRQHLAVALEELAPQSVQGGILATAVRWFQDLGNEEVVRLLQTHAAGDPDLAQALNRFCQERELAAQNMVQLEQLVQEQAGRQMRRTSRIIDNLSDDSEHTSEMDVALLGCLGSSSDDEN